MMKDNSKITKSLTSIFVGLVVLGVFFLHKGNAYVHPNL